MSDKKTLTLGEFVSPPCECPVRCRQPVCPTAHANRFARNLKAEREATSGE